MMIEILKGNTQTHLWFIYAIIICYIFVPILKPLVQNAPSEILIYGIVVCIFMGYIFNFHRYFTIGYISYFLLGAYIDRYAITFKARKIIYGLGVISLVITISLVIWDCMSTQMLSERYWSYTMPSMYISSMALYIFFKNYHFNNHIKKILVKVSEKSLGIYGIHFACIALMWKIGFSTFLFIGILSVPVISLLVLLLSYVVSLLLERIPLIGRIIA